MACGKPFHEGESECHPAQPAGEPKDGRTRPDAVVTPSRVVDDDSLPKPIGKVVHLPQNGYPFISSYWRQADGRLHGVVGQRSAFFISLSFQAGNEKCPWFWPTVRYGAPSEREPGGAQGK